MTILRVPNSLKTTGKVGTDMIGSTASSNPSASIILLFSTGIAIFLNETNSKTLSNEEDTNNKLSLAGHHHHSIFLTS